MQRLTTRGQVMPYGDIDLKTWNDIGSVNRLLPNGTKPLPKPMWSSHQKCTVAFSEQFHKKCAWTKYHVFKDYSLKITTHLPGINKLKLVRHEKINMPHIK